MAARLELYALLVCLSVPGCTGETDSNGPPRDAGADTAPATDANQLPDAAAGDARAAPDAAPDAAPEVDMGSGSSGCGADPAHVGDRLEVEDVTRTFVISIPPGYDPSRPYPLVFGLHGGGGTGAGARAAWGLDDAVGADAVVVYPDGLPEFEGGDTVWNLDPAGAGFVFFDRLLDHLEAHLCIDAQRVFATGWSMGGFMANSLGCYRADTVRAVASVSGGVPGPKPPAPPYAPCAAQMPAMIVHGTSDAVIPLAFGEEMRDIFAANNGCAPTSAITQPAPCVAYDDCDAPLHWCAFAGGHIWPPFAADGVWRFFADQ